MAVAASAPVLPNKKKQCCKIARFTDASCILIVLCQFCACIAVGDVDLQLSLILLSKADDEEGGVT